MLKTPGLDAAKVAAAAVVGPAPRCPRCDCRDASPCVEVQVGYEESFISTHECGKCRTRFRSEPGAGACRSCGRSGGFHETSCPEVAP